jgi:hypothetical protein
VIVNRGCPYVTNLTLLAHHLRSGDTRFQAVLLPLTHGRWHVSSVICNPHRVMIDNLPFHTLVHAGLTIEGYSRAAVQTYWRIPELKLGFDMGGSPWEFTGTQTFIFSHAHLDHMLALPGYVSRRRMMKMEPPVLIVPEEIVENVDKMLRAWQRLDRGRMIYSIIGMVPGQEHLGAAQETQARVSGTIGQ